MSGIICDRCGLSGGRVLNLDTGGKYHTEPIHCIVLQAERIRELEAERGQWQESNGQNYVRATEAEMREERLREENANLLLHITAMRDWNSIAIAHSEVVQAENQRLREAIEAHEVDVRSARVSWGPADERLWKALENTDGQ